MTEIQKKHYFDWASTSPLDVEIIRDALEKTQNIWANPSSIHSGGKEAKNLLENARALCAEVLDVKPEQLFFTSGGTEGDHIPLLSILNKPQKEGTVLLSSIEHPALREMATSLKKCGINVVQIPADKNGIITEDAVLQKLTEDTLLVCVMSVNNETGAIQPIYKIADVIKNFSNGKRKIRFHVDCVQAAGKIPLNLNYPGIDSASFSAHKISGPRGIGLLYSKDIFEPFLKGGGQEHNIRSGTENLFGAVAFAECLKKYYITQKNPSSIDFFNEMSKNTIDFVQKLSQISGCTLIPESRLKNPENYSPFVVQASFKNIPGQVMLRALDAEGFYISTGSACSSKKNNRPVLAAMNVSGSLSENAVRFSFGHSTTKQDLSELFEKVLEIYKRFNKE